MNRAHLRRLLLSAAAGLLLASGFPPIQLSILLPVGVSLLILALEGRDITTRQGAYSGLLAGLVFYGITLSWLFNLFGAAAISLLFISAAFPMLFGGLYVSSRKRFPTAPAWLLAALLWTGVEYYRSERFWLDFGWMGLGYGPIGNGIFGGAASAVGSYGVTFLIVAIGATAATAPLPGPARIAFTLSLVILWLAMFWLPIPQPEPNNPISVRLVQARAGEPEDAIRLSSPKDARPVDVILWPEYSVLEDPTKEARLWPKLQQLARTEHAYLIFGGKEQLDPADDAKYRNTAYLLDPEGNLVGKHYKNHTVHLMRDGIPGTEANPIQTSLGPVGVAICFDMDYPDVARRLVQRGAEVLLVPNMDPDEWGDLQRAQHRLMFQMRAAECGRWLARADVAGGTSVAAPNGEEVERINTAQPSSMDVIVGRELGRTLYVQGGWLFGPACLAGTAAVVLVGWITGRRRVR